MGLGLAALVLLVLGCLNFYNEWDFGNRAVAVQATVAVRDVGIGTRRHRSDYRVQLRFDLAGQSLQVWARMSRSAWLQIKVGQAVDLRVDPDTPRIFEWHGTVYALWGLVQAMAGLVFAALTALSVWAGRGPARWRGAAFPWLADRG